MAAFQPGIGDFIAFVSIVTLSVVINLYVARSYAPRPQTALGRGPQGWLGKWSVWPDALGGFSYGKLALVSVLTLFLELLMIRWVSTEVRVFAYLKNFVLIACFLGFGLGCYLCRRRVSLLAMLVPLLALAIILKLPGLGFQAFLGRLPMFIGELCEVDVRGVLALPRTWFELTELLQASAVVVPLFGLIAFIFVPLGQLVGWYLETAPEGIWGYTVNLLGSLGGIVLFTLLCFLDQPPMVWFVVAGILLIGLLWSSSWLRWAAAVPLVFCIALAALGPGKPYQVYWSPYQKLTLRPILARGEVISYEVSTNDSWYQQIFNLAPDFVRTHPHLFYDDAGARWNPYNLPYRFYPKPDSVLVLGAGTGNDVAGALRNGASRVVAVEIDPLILQLGRKLHFEKPYNSARVQTVVDDARSYLQNSQERFDLILFSLLDSHTTGSYYSNIRIDNYVYTREAFEAAKHLLKPGGLLVVKFWVETPWIAGRLLELTTATFGRPPLHLNAGHPFYSTSGQFFICGSPARIEQSLADPELRAYLAGHQAIAVVPATITTDDWPYFYQHEPGLPGAVVVLSVVLLLLGGGLLRRTGVTRRSWSWHFFFLGAGFLLLEAQIVSKMALLFGTTWMVNAVVISGLLLLIVGSNVVVLWKPRIGIGWAYAGIFASMLASYAVPLERFFLAGFWLKALTATAVFCLPVFFAGIVFIRSFARAGFRGHALGSNLLGALFGGLLESLSMWTGIRSLLVAAGVLYLLSWLALAVEIPAADKMPEDVAPRAEG